LIFKLDPFKLEELVAGMYERQGFEVTLTPRSGDFGRDVIAVKPGFGTVRLIESVKRYGPDHRVPANDVRALLGVLAGDPRASKGIVTTTSDFAPRIAEDPFIQPFIPFRLELVNGTDLLKRFADAAEKKQ
jgi:restriction system protein